MSRSHITFFCGEYVSLSGWYELVAAGIFPFHVSAQRTPFSLRRFSMAFPLFRPIMSNDRTKETL